jgi:hypothetical protein
MIHLPSRNVYDRMRLKKILGKYNAGVYAANPHGLLKNYSAIKRI